MRRLEEPKRSERRLHGVSGSRSSPLRLEDLRERDDEPRQHVLAVEVVDHAEQAGGAVRSIDGRGPGLGSDHPHQPGAGVEVVAHLLPYVHGIRRKIRPGARTLRRMLL